MGGTEEIRKLVSTQQVQQLLVTLSRRRGKRCEAQKKENFLVTQNTQHNNNNQKTKDNKALVNNVELSLRHLCYVID